MDIFINQIFQDEILNNVISSMFPNLIFSHKQIILKYVVRLLNVISLCFDFRQYSTINICRSQLKQNDYQDIKWLIVHLLPFIDERGGYDKIVTLDDIYVKKKHNVDINQTEPEYVYSNVQYNRCIRNKNNYQEIKFSEEFIEHNFYLLCDTIKSISYKMYINWIDIIPVINCSVNSIEKTLLHAKTHHTIINKKLQDWDPCIDANMNIPEDIVYEKLSKKIFGLPICHIYDVIVNEFYHTIKGIKWLIYDIRLNIDINNAYLFPSIFVLGIFFEDTVSKCTINTKWNDLTYEFKEKFKTDWTYIINRSFNNEGISREHAFLQINSLKLFLKGLIVSFDKQMKNTPNEYNQGYISIEQTLEFNKKLYEDLEDDDEVDEQESNKLKYEDVIPSLKSVQPMYVYEFLRVSIQKFKHTHYGSKILKEDGTNIDTNFEFPYVDESGENNHVTYKNIYNFAKSLSHFVRGKAYLEYPNYWRSLDDDQKKEILKRLNREYPDPTEWFYMPRYIRFMRASIYASDQEVKNINTKIFLYIMNRLAFFVLNAMDTRGILSFFAPEGPLTNLKITQRQDIYKKNKNLNRTTPSEISCFYDYAYDFMSNLKYKNNNGFRLGPNDSDTFKIKSDEKLDFWTYSNSKEGSWYKAYAFDWIAQIGFCHHFIHNRITFITGATGVGKSTQVPKMYLYYLKAIDHNNNGKVVCTQPRRAPVVNLSDIVSKELGHPISVYNPQTNKKVESNEYYVQFRYRIEYDQDETPSELEHMKDHFEKVYSCSLEYITDGLLYQELNDPLFKMYSEKEDQNNIKIYKPMNKYDVIMVDESHEHKINMDMILTIMKTPMTYNNSIRLVILSATMDEDEPRYRRFYRDINDNRKFPFDKWIEKHNLDRINVDRRLHISPVGFGTRFPIHEKYVDNENPVDIVKEIVSQSNSGEILLFQPGMAEINKTVEELNKSGTLPTNTIAIPYHAKLKKNQRSFIENFNSESVKNLDIEKDEDFTEKIDFIKYNVGKYKRVIIVATNIAEASITIPTLKYVIDTGYQKINTYDYVKNSSKLVKRDISESSRLQRRGRVGRVDEGYIYYLYPQGKMENNKIQYEISNNDLSLILYPKLRTNLDEPELISQNLDLNSPFIRIFIKDEFYNLLNDEIKKKSKIIPPFDHIEFIDLDGELKTIGLARIIKNQYFNVDSYYQYFGNPKHYDYQNYVPPEKYYQTGYNFRTLNDHTGVFYLIHPNELQIKRNINGDIVGIKLNEDNNKNEISYHQHTIKSSKMISFWRLLIDYMYLSIEKINEKVDEKIDEKIDFPKTEMGIKMMNFFTELGLENHKLFRCLIFGMALGCGEDMMKLHTMYSILPRMSPIQISEKIDRRLQFERVKSNIIEFPNNNKRSDSHYLLSILNDLHRYLDLINIPLNLTDNEYINKVTNVENLETYTATDFISILGPKDKFTPKIMNKVTITYRERKKIVDQVEDTLMRLFKHKIFGIPVEFEKKRNVIVQIQEWCQTRGVNSEIIGEYLIKYIKFRTLMNRNLTDDMINFIKTLRSSLSIPLLMGQEIDLITFSIFLGYPTNVSYKVMTSEFYLSIYNFSVDNYFLMPSLSPDRLIPETFVNLSYLQDYVLYMETDTEKNMMYGLHLITPKMISLLIHIYSKYHFNDIYITNDDIQFSVDQQLKNKEKNTHLILSRFNEVLNKIKIDMSQYDEYTGIRLISNMDKKFKSYFEILQNIGQKFIK